MSKAMMRVYVDEDGAKRLISRADIPADVGPVYEVPLFGATSTILERYTIGGVTHFRAGEAAPHVERAVLASPGQLVELLPGWQPFAS